MNIAVAHIGWFAIIGPDRKNMTAAAVVCWCVEPLNNRLVGFVPLHPGEPLAANNGAAVSGLVNAETLEHFSHYAFMPHLLAPPPGQVAVPRIIR